MTITPKPQDQKNKKHETLKRLFGLASKVFGFPCVFLVFFDFEMHKVYGWRKSPKTKKKVFCISKPNKKQKKHKEKTKKTSFEAKPKSLFKVLVFWFFVLRFWDYCHSLHIASFQIYQDDKQGLYYLCVCVSYIYMYVCLEGHDTRGFEVYLRGLQYIYIYIHINIYMYTYKYIHIYIYTYIYIYT